MSNYNKNSGYGQAILNRVQQTVPVFGKIFVVCPSSDANYGRLSQVFTPDTDGVNRLFTTIESAYAAVTSDENDVILLAANALHTTAAMLTIAKNRVHIIGMDGGKHITGQRTRLDITAAATDAAVTLKVTGVGCTFHNLKIQNSGTHVNSIAAAIFAGEACVYENCSFMKLTDLDQTAVADVIMGDDSDTFINCEFGFDTLCQTAARPTMLFNSTLAGARAKDNYYINCMWKSQSSSNGKLHIQVTDGNSVLFTHFFDNPVFINSLVNGGGIQGTVAMASHASLTDGMLLFRNVFTNSASFCTTSTNVVVTSPVASTNAFEGVTPA